MKGSVKKLRQDEQPREKLIRYGAQSLSESELLAILIRTGSARMNVLATARELLDHFGDLRTLARKDWQALRVIPGIGDVKAITLASIFELARRIEESRIGERITIRSPDDAAAFFAPRLRDLPREVFMVAFLNNAKRLTGFRTISSGGATATIVDPAEVMKQAMLNDACSILLLHNHPSGQARESTADIRLTKRIAEAGKVMGVPVDDHIIIAGDTYLSLRSRGLL